MPLYSFLCHHCGDPFDAFHKIEDRDDLTNCPHCGSVDTDRRISAAHIAPDFAGYSCPITGDWIEGRRAHTENLKKHGCRVFEPGETRDAAAFRAAEERKLDDALDRTVGEFVEALPTAKRERLASEMEAGLDAQIVRK